MKPINNADFGKTADDYLTHQAGFLKSLFEKLQSQGIGIRNQGITDLGAGTGSLVARFRRQWKSGHGYRSSGVYARCRTKGCRSCKFSRSISARFSRTDSAPSKEYGHRGSGTGVS